MPSFFLLGVADCIRRHFNAVANRATLKNRKISLKLNILVK
jgi:hypothetical protein